MKQASEQLRDLRRAIMRGEYVHHSYLDEPIRQVEHMEEQADDWPKERTGDPDTSYFDGTLESLKRNQRDVFACHQMFGVMDSATFEELYDKHQPYQGWKMQSVSGLRTRRRELVRLGLVERVDNDGTSPTGRKAGRYRVTQ